LLIQILDYTSPLNKTLKREENKIESPYFFFKTVPYLSLNFKNNLKIIKFKELKFILK